MKTFGDLSNAELRKIAAQTEENPGGAATAAAVLERRQSEAIEDAEPGMCCCVCGTTWNRIGGFRRLMDVTCPACGAGYADCGWNVEP